MSTTNDVNPFNAARQVVPVLLLIAGLATAYWGWQQYQDVAQWSEEEIKASVFLNAKIQRAKQQAAIAGNSALSLESEADSFTRVDKELRAELAQDKEAAQIWIFSGAILFFLGVIPLVANLRRKLAEAR